MEKENPDLRVQLENEKKRMQEVSIILLSPSSNQPHKFFIQLTVLFNERENFLQMKRKELRLKEDDFIRNKKDLERQIAQLKRDTESQKVQIKPGAVDTELENLRVSK